MPDESETDLYFGQPIKRSIAELDQIKKTRKQKSGNTDSLVYSCYCCLLAMVIIFLLGGWTFDYSLNAMVGKEIPFFADCVGGLLTAECVLVVAPFLWICHLCGMNFPMVVL